MSFRSVAVAAVAGVVVVALLYAVVYPGLSAGGQFWLNAVARVGMLALVAICAGLAAQAFGWWSEYVGRAWTLFFIEYALLTVSELLRRAAPDTASLASGALVIIANIAGIGAYVLMARSLDAAGLGDYTSRGKKVLAAAIALIAAAALCWGPITSASSLNGLVSPLADVITFVLVAPLLLTVIALRGGQLFWIFALLTAGTIGWMVNQGASTILRAMGAGENAMRTGRMTGFAMACFLIAAAAFTQWLAARRATLSS